MPLPTDHAGAMLDLLKTHHPDAGDAVSDRELLGYALADMCLLAARLGSDWGAVTANAAVDARYMRNLSIAAE
ncbi:hypothetical protein [Falsirhodobacter sp. 20TX0035]|uniref:hypothetical protein n=1 Tax=Falsirhodobacter sp. 20TX0035 TaxID=3022019 RepID=UPI00232D08AE|nr:hypothetical protein [Falsirhodobacter sp. 20TX0035]MDB6454738.1 hypothetical protein [Falsirhodobacter sp. 20TX0035]